MMQDPSRRLIGQLPICSFSSLLLLQLAPAPVQLVYLVLRFFHLCMRRQKTWAIAGYLRVFQLDAFGLQHLFGVGDALLNGGVLARLQIGELCFRRRASFRSCSLRSQTSGGLRRLVALSLP